MAVYGITGKLGTGKTKTCVRRMQEALRDGRRVVSNIDLDLVHLVGSRSRAYYVRIPDKPTVVDLEVIGCGNESYDEARNGLIVLDELGSWLNARTFQDKARQPVLDWLIHSRKKGWDVYFIMQNVLQIDKQVRESLLEYVGRCVRLDKVPIPFVTRVLSILSVGLVDLRVPRCHLVSVRLGAQPDGMVVDRWLYRGDDLHKAYDTRQIFSEGYPHGSHSVLSGWHTQGRYAKPSLPWWRRLFCRAKVVPALKPKLPIVSVLSRLPVDQRVKHWMRCEALGLLSRSVGQS